MLPNLTSQSTLPPAIRVILAGSGENGPFFHGVRVLCTPEQYHNGDHYDAAREHALEEKIFDQETIVAFDEVDGPDWLFTHMNSSEWTEVDLASSDKPPREPSSAGS